MRKSANSFFSTSNEDDIYNYDVNTLKSNKNSAIIRNEKNQNEVVSSSKSLDKAQFLLEKYNNGNFGWENKYQNKPRILNEDDISIDSDSKSGSDESELSAEESIDETNMKFGHAVYSSNMNDSYDETQSSISQSAEDSTTSISFTQINRLNSIPYHEMDPPLPQPSYQKEVNNTAKLSSKIASPFKTIESNVNSILYVSDTVDQSDLRNNYEQSSQYEEDSYEEIDDEELISSKSKSQYNDDVVDVDEVEEEAVAFKHRIISFEDLAKEDELEYNDSFENPEEGINLSCDNVLDQVSVPQSALPSSDLSQIDAKPNVSPIIMNVPVLSSQNPISHDNENISSSALPSASSHSTLSHLSAPTNQPTTSFDNTLPTPTEEYQANGIPHRPQTTSLPLQYMYDKAHQAQSQQVFGSQSAHEYQPSQGFQHPPQISSIPPETTDRSFPHNTHTLPQYHQHPQYQFPMQESLPNLHHPILYPQIPFPPYPYYGYPRPMDYSASFAPTPTIGYNPIFYGQFPAPTFPSASAMHQFPNNNQFPIYPNVIGPTHTSASMTGYNALSASNHSLQNLATNLAASRTSTLGATINPMISSNPNLLGETLNPSSKKSNDSVIIELLQELKVAKEEAAWAQTKLVEVISLLNKNKAVDATISDSMEHLYRKRLDQQENDKGNFRASINSTLEKIAKNELDSAKPISSKVISRYSSDNVEDEEDDIEDYSNDFEVSTIPSPSEILNDNVVSQQLKKPPLGNFTTAATTNAFDKKEEFQYTFQPPLSRNNSQESLGMNTSINSTLNKSSNQLFLEQLTTSSNQSQLPVSNELSTSLLSSQMLFRQQLDSLKSRIQATSSLQSSLPQFSQSRIPPTLSGIFETEKHSRKNDRGNVESYIHLLRQLDPKMGDNYARKLTSSYNV